MKPLRLRFPPRMCMPLWKLGNCRLFVSPFACLFMYTSSPVCLSGAFVRVFVCVCGRVISGRGVGCRPHSSLSQVCWGQPLSESWWHTTVQGANLSVRAFTHTHKHTLIDPHWSRWYFGSMLSPCWLFTDLCYNSFFHLWLSSSPLRKDQHCQRLLLVNCVNVQVVQSWIWCKKLNRLTLPC